MYPFCFLIKSIRSLFITLIFSKNQPSISLMFFIIFLFSISLIYLFLTDLRFSFLLYFQLKVEAQTDTCRDLSFCNISFKPTHFSLSCTSQILIMQIFFAFRTKHFQFLCNFCFELCIIQNYAALFPNVLGYLDVFLLLISNLICCDQRTYYI